MKIQESTAVVHPAPSSDGWRTCLELIAVQWQRFQENKASLIALVTQEAHTAIEDIHWDLVDDMKSCIAAQVANACSDDEDQQEQAIDMAEAWVADNVSNNGSRATVAMAMWLHGIDEGRRLVTVRDECSG